MSFLWQTRGPGIIVHQLELSTVLVDRVLVLENDVIDTNDHADGLSVEVNRLIMSSLDLVFLVGEHVGRGLDLAVTLHSSTEKSPSESYV